jgi:hypothetical protein
MFSCARGASLFGMGGFGIAHLAAGDDRQQNCYRR